MTYAKAKANSFGKTEASTKVGGHETKPMEKEESCMQTAMCTLEAL